MEKQKTIEDEKKERNKKAHEDDEPTAHSYDRDKNKVYHPNDESVDEILNDDGYRNVIHPNHDLGSLQRP